MLGPRRNGIGQALSDHALEAWDFSGLVEPTEQVVERTVLEYHEDDMVQGIRSTDQHLTSLIGPESHLPRAG
jgi:hypothetical protein